MGGQMGGEIIDITLVIGVFVALFSAGMTAYAGFGGALVMVPAFALMIGPVQAVALTAICSAIALTHVMPGLLRTIRWREVLPLFAGLFLSISVASSFLVKADPDLIRMIMGGFILAAAAILIINPKYAGPRGPKTSLGVGLLTGTIMGGVGVPAGPVMVLYFLAAEESPPVQRANIMVSVWLLLILMLVNLLVRGAINSDTALNALIIAPASILGAYVGKWLFKRAPVTWFKSFAHGLLIIIGLSLLVV